MKRQPTGLLAQGYVTVRYKGQCEFDGAMSIKYYGRAYFANMHPVVFSSVRYNVRFKEALQVRSIYHLFKDGDLVYIGITDNLFKRLEEHSRVFGNKWDAYVSFSVEGMTREEMRHLEAMAIKELNPVLNTQWVGGKYNHRCSKKALPSAKRDYPTLIPIESLGFVFSPPAEVEASRCKAKEYLFV